MASNPRPSPDDLDRSADDRPEVKVLFDRLKAAFPDLERILGDYSGHWDFEDPVYRFYHQSFKVYGLQKATIRIVASLQALAPDRKLNEDFVKIVSEGTGKEFEPSHNRRWAEETRPILEAFFHARFFLEMAVRYGKTLERPPALLPSGWAAFLYLYELR